MQFNLELLERRDLLAAIPIISEFMAKNDGFFDDGDGNSPDWVEIQNVGDETLDLNGYHLTDKAGDLSRWTFPSVHVEPGEYLVVFASGQDTDDYTDAEGNLHANFSLSANGEFLALVNPDGSVVSKLSDADYPPQHSNLSFGVAQNETWISEQNNAAYWVPSDGTVDDVWKQQAFDAEGHGFLQGESVLGYERGSLRSPYSFQDEIVTALPDESLSVYVRYELNLQDVASVTRLNLQMKYDDGFVAYLNGVRVAEANAPPVANWSSRATNRRSDQRAFSFEEFDLGGSLSHLVEGTNVFAIHGLSAATDSSGMLVSPRLTATTNRLDAKVGFMTSPTPGFANASAESVFSGLVGATTISADAGFYDSPFEVTIDASTPDATIRYTTDGSRPTATNGDVYTVPIQIDTTTTLRAASFLPEHVPSAVVSRSYLFLQDVIRQSNDQPGLPTRWEQPGHRFEADYEMDQDIVNAPAYRDEILPGLQSIRTMSITMNPEDFLGPDGIYIDTGGHGAESERAVSVEIINPDGSMAFQVDAGLRNNGNRTRDFDVTLKQSFRLVFSPRHGPTKLEYQLFDDSPAERFDNIILHASKLLDDPQLIRNSFGRDTNRAMGNADAHSTYVHLYLNGLYWGLYNAFERVDAEFAQTYFGGSDSDYDAILNNSERIDGGSQNYNTIWRDLRQGLETREAYEQFERQIDLDSLFDLLLVNQYMAHDEHESRAIGNREGDANFKFFIQDVDEGGMDRVRARMSMAGFLPGSSYDLLREHPETRMRYADRAHKHLFNDGALTPEVAAERWATRYSEIYTAVIGETARWGDTHWRSVFPRQAVQRDVEMARESEFLTERFFPQRTDVLIDQLRRADIYPDIDAPVFNRFGGTVPVDFELMISNPNASGIIYYTLDATDPRSYGGDVNPTAMRYDGGDIGVQHSQLVKARVLADGEWSALTEASFDTVNADFNEDGIVSPVDVDAVCTGIRIGDGRADVNADGQLDNGDLLHFVQNVLQTEIGDSDLDGAFTLSDLRIQEFEDNVVGNSTWAEGDWDCDRESTSRDIVWAFMVSPAPAAAMQAATQLARDAAVRFSLEPRDTNHVSWLNQRSRESEALRNDHQRNEIDYRIAEAHESLPLPRHVIVDSLFTRSDHSDSPNADSDSKYASTAVRSDLN